MMFYIMSALFLAYGVSLIMWMKNMANWQRNQDKMQRLHFEYMQHLSDRIDSRKPPCD